MSLLKAILPFEQHHVHDPIGRSITYYLASPPTDATPKPLVVFVQGSGCHSVFRKNEEGKILGGYQNVLWAAASGSASVLVVEKPGVSFLDSKSQNGRAEGCSDLFLFEHTLPRWCSAITAAIRDVSARQDIVNHRILLVGHSEGGIVAARIAAQWAEVSHVALLSSSGPTQLFDLIMAAMSMELAGESEEAKEERVEVIYKTLAAIQSNPDSIKEFAWGHPFRRWSSFFSTSTLDELLRTNAQIYLAYGSKDPIIPRAAFEILRAGLLVNHKRVLIDLVYGGDHSLRQEGAAADESMKRVFNRILNWFTK